MFKNQLSLLFVKIITVQINLTSTIWKNLIQESEQITILVIS